MNEPTTREATTVPAPRTEPDQTPATAPVAAPAVPAQRRPETARLMRAIRGI